MVSADLPVSEGRRVDPQPSGEFVEGQTPHGPDGAQPFAEARTRLAWLVHEEADHARQRQEVRFSVYYAVARLRRPRRIGCPRPGGCRHGGHSDPDANPMPPSVLLLDPLSDMRAFWMGIVGDTQDVDLTPEPASGLQNDQQGPICGRRVTRATNMIRAANLNAAAIVRRGRVLRCKLASEASLRKSLGASWRRGLWSARACLNLFRATPGDPRARRPVSSF
jgi:hypothetical protein